MKFYFRTKPCIKIFWRKFIPSQYSLGAWPFKMIFIAMVELPA